MIGDEVLGEIGVGDIEVLGEIIITDVEMTDMIGTEIEEVIGIGEVVPPRVVVVVVVVEAGAELGLIMMAAPQTFPQEWAVLVLRVTLHRIRVVPETLGTKLPPPHSLPGEQIPPPAEYNPLEDGEDRLPRGQMDISLPKKVGPLKDTDRPPPKIPQLPRLPPLPQLPQLPQLRKW